MLEYSDELSIHDSYAEHLIYHEFLKIKQYTHKAIKKCQSQKGLSFKIKAIKVMEYMAYRIVEHNNLNLYMQNLIKFQAVVIGHDERNYILKKEDGKEFKASFYSMHSRVIFPKEMLEVCPNNILEKYEQYIEGLLNDGILKTGVKLYMSAKEMVDIPGVYRYYPDQDCYTKRSYTDITRLKNGFEEMKTIMNLNTTVTSHKENLSEETNLLIQELVKNQDSLNAKSFEHLLTSLVSLIENKDKVSLLLRTILLKDEDEHTEYKSSFFHPAGQSMISDSTYQRKIILKELIGFANAQREGTVYVGITDDKRVVGIQEEIKTFWPDKSFQDFEMEFKNMAKQCTGDAKFAMSLDFQWRRDMDLDGHLVCQITIPVWLGDILMFNGNELYVRHKNTIQHLENKNMIDFIRDYAVKRNTGIVQSAKEIAVN